MVFTSDAAAIARAARTLDAYYVQEGRIRIDTIGPKWAPIGAANDPKDLNRHWVAGVSTQYAALGGDPGEPVLIGSQGASCATKTPTGAPEAASSTPPAATDRSSGPAEVTTLAGAALMICLVGYLAARRRRVVLSAAGARDSRFAWEREERARTAPSHFADEMTAAHAQSAATASEALSIAWASEDAEWTLDDPPEDEATGEDGETGEEIPAEDDVPTRPMDEALPAPQAAPGPAAAIDPEAAYWSWAEGECSGHDDEQPDWPAGWRPAEEPDAAPAAVIVEPEEAAVADVADQAAIVADLVPALLEGILPIERVCDRAEVTPRMLALMRIVADAPLPVTEQARRLGLPRALVAGLCARMQALGLAQREPLADDARRHTVALTPAGYELCSDSAPAPDAARVETVLARMSPAERAALLAGLTALTSPSAV
jgi:DNA-binding MarR family transcriptional regulator